MQKFLAAVMLLVSTGLGAAPTFRVALLAPSDGSSDWSRVDPAAARPIHQALAESLVSFDPQTGLVTSGLASTWTVSPDGRTWTFALKAAFWSDGKALTAQDVADAWQRAGVRAQVSAASARSLVVLFDSPPASPTVLAAPPYLLLPDPETGRSCGPFRVEGSTVANPLVLVKNPAYRNAKGVLLDRLEFYGVRTWSEAGALYRDGRVDWVPRGGGPGTWPEPKLKDAVSSPGLGTVFLRLNLRSPRLGDAAYRRLLASSLDRSTLAQGLRGPLLLPAATSKVDTKVYGPLPEPKLTILHLQGETYRAIASEVAAQWTKRLGLEVKVQAVPQAQWKSARVEGQGEVVVSSWLDDAPDPVDFLALFRTGSLQNDLGWSNANYDAAVDRLRFLPPGKVRTLAVDEARRELASDVPIVELLWYGAVNQINLKKWAGWSANPADVHPWVGITLAKSAPLTPSRKTR